MIASYPERIVTGFAGAVLLGLAAWSWSGASKVGGIMARPVAVTLGEDAPDGQPVVVPEGTTRLWTDPAINAAQPEWVFDVFTPPVIYYDRESKNFTVTPPVYSEAANEPVVIEEPPFGVELAEVRLEPFRLQLVGYAGGEGNYLGVFENMVTGEPVLGREGKAFPELQLRIVSLEVARRDVPMPEGEPIRQTVATARVLDEGSGEELELSSLSRRVVGSPTAILMISAHGEQRSEKVGGEFVVDGASYRIESISADTGTVTVVKQVPGADVISATLRAAPSTDPSAASRLPAKTRPFN